MVAPPNPDPHITSTLSGLAAPIAAPCLVFDGEGALAWCNLSARERFPSPRVTRLDHLAAVGEFSLLRVEDAGQRWALALQHEAGDPWQSRFHLPASRTSPR